MEGAHFILIFESYSYFCLIVPKKREKLEIPASNVGVKSCYFDERHSHGVLLDVLFNGVTHSQNELVGYHEDQDVGPFHRLHQVWNGYLTEIEMRYRRDTVKHIDPAASRWYMADGVCADVCSPHWGAACDRADTSRFHGLC